MIEQIIWLSVLPVLLFLTYRLVLVALRKFEKKRIK
jgi:hypothetical protein